MCYQKKKPKYLVKNLSAALQAKINPLVNKVRVHKYLKDPPKLIYPKYLNPPSSSYQQASPSHVFTSYLDPAISSKLYLLIDGFFQYFPHEPKLHSAFRLGEVSVWTKNLSRMCNWRGRSRGKHKRNCIDYYGFTISNF